MKRPAKKPTDHMIVSPIWQGAMLCFRCGTRFDLKMPIQLGEMVARTKDFFAEHQHCKASDVGRSLKKRHTGAWRRFQAIKEAARMPA